MPNCVELLKKAFPKSDPEFIQSMHELLESVRKDNSIGLKEKAIRYKEHLENGKALKALFLKDKIDAELKHNKNLEVADHVQSRSNIDDGALSPLENVEGNEITVDSLTNSNQQLLLVAMEKELKNNGLEDAAKSAKFDEDVMDVMHTGKYMEGDSGKAKIVNKLADIYRSINEAQRQMLNGSGASIFKRLDYIHRQFHSAKAISEVKFEVWYAEIKKRVNLEKSFPGVHEIEVKKKLEGDYKRFIAREDAVSGYEPSSSVEARSTRSSTIDLLNKGRTYQFNNAKDFKAYNDVFGSQKSLHDTLTTESVRSARKAALIKKFGRSPKAGYDSFVSSYIQKHNLTAPEAKALRTKTDIAFDIAAGRGALGIDNRLSQIGNAARSWSLVTMLGKAGMSGMMDIVPTIMHSKTATGDNLIKTMSRSFFENIKSLSPAHRKAMSKDFLISIDAYSDAVKEAMMGGSYKAGKMQYMINGVFKLSGLDFVTSVSRRANADLALRDIKTIANSAKHTTEQINFIKRYDLNTKELAVIRANPTLSPSSMVDFTPDSLGLSKTQHAELKQKMHIIINQRISRGSPLPDNRTRRRLKLNNQAGTIEGEAARYFAQFKSSIMKITQDVGYMAKATSPDGRMMNKNTMMAMAQWVVLGTSVGMMRNIASDFLTKGDEFEFDEWFTSQNIMRGFVTGGGAAIYGDIIAPMFSSDSPRDLVAAAGSMLVGPTGGNIAKGLFAGKEVLEGDLDKNTAKFITDNIPGQNLWFLMDLNKNIAEMLNETFE